jgi:predicted membrane-bound mannosyltransferase
MGIGISIVIAVLLFSSFLSNATGPLDSVRTYSHWLSRAGGASPHTHGWGFYIHRLLFFHAVHGPIWSEALVFVLAIIGGAAGFARKWLGSANPSFVRFLAFYSTVLGLFYNLISYKTPWCLLNFWLGFLLLAGVGAAVLARAAKLQWARTAMTLVLAIGACQLGAQAWDAAFKYEADPRSPYVYGHTSENILECVEKVEALASAHADGNHLLVKVIAPEDDYWPLPWYLRSLDHTGYYSKIPDEPLAPVMIVSSRFNAGLDEKKTHLMAGYFQLRPGVFFELYVELGLWKQYLENQRRK